MVIAQRAQLFSFAALPAGPPSKANWYQSLLDDPGCNGDQKKVQEAYESQRNDRLDHCSSMFLQGLSAPKADVLLREIIDSRPRAQDREDVNCLVLWARPESSTIKLIDYIQKRLKFLGDSIYLVPAQDAHLSVLELSHRHPVAHLEAVVNRIGHPLLRRMLDLPYQESLRGREARLVSPQVSFDSMGLALTFVPATDSSINEPESRDREPFTYHHLRNALHKLALSSGIEIDTCYTAPSAHIAVARFVQESYFLDGDDPPRTQHFVDCIRRLNKELSSGVWSTHEWSIASDKGLELQLGYVKYGRGTQSATLTGKPQSCVGRKEQASPCE